MSKCVTSGHLIFEWSMLAKKHFLQMVLFLGIAYCAYFLTTVTVTIVYVSFSI